MQFWMEYTLCFNIKKLMRTQSVVHTFGYHRGKINGSWSKYVFEFERNSCQQNHQITLLFMTSKNLIVPGLNLQAILEEIVSLLHARLFSYVIHR